MAMPNCWTAAVPSGLTLTRGYKTMMNAAVPLLALAYVAFLRTLQLGLLAVCKTLGMLAASPKRSDRRVR